MQRGWRAGVLVGIGLLAALGARAGDCSASAAPAQAPLLIRNVQVLPMAPEGPDALERHAVLVQDGRITRVAPDAGFTVPSDATVIDGRGHFVLPGLIDVHVHVWDTPELSAYLAAGVTTVRNASGMSFHLDYARRIEGGCLEGPRLLTTGPILNGPGPNAQPNHVIVGDAAQARAAVRAQHAQGYRHLKVYSNLSKDAYRAIVGEARLLGMTLMGHPPEGVREEGVPHRKPFQINFRDLLPDGFVSIEHMESIVWHALADELDEAKLRALAKDIAHHGVAVTPTLVAHHNLVRVAQTRGQFLKRPGVQWLNPFITELEQDSYRQWSQAPPDGRRRFDDFYQRATKIFHDEGVTLLAGTDAGIFTNVPGQSLIDELGLLVQAGLTPLHAIEAATRHAAAVLGLGGRLGEVKPGHLADLLLVDGDPRQDIGRLRAVTGVVVAGAWRSPEDLARLRRQAAATSYERSKQQILRALEAQGTPLR